MVKKKSICFSMRKKRTAVNIRDFFIVIVFIVIIFLAMLIVLETI